MLLVGEPAYSKSPLSYMQYKPSLFVFGFKLAVELECKQGYLSPDFMLSPIILNKSSLYKISFPYLVSNSKSNQSI